MNTIFIKTQNLKNDNMEKIKMELGKIYYLDYGNNSIFTEAGLFWKEVV